MNKVVYNNCYGGYCLSLEAMKWLAENARQEIKDIVCKRLAERPNNNYGYNVSEINRHDKDLVRCVETLGKLACGGVSKLRVFELRGSAYRIDDYDGWERVIEPDPEEYIYIE